MQESRARKLNPLYVAYDRGDERRWGWQRAGVSLVSARGGGAQLKPLEALHHHTHTHSLPDACSNTQRCFSIPISADSSSSPMPVGFEEFSQGFRHACDYSHRKWVHASESSLEVERDRTKSGRSDAAITLRRFAFWFFGRAAEDCFNHACTERSCRSSEYLSWNNNTEIRGTE